MKKLILGLVLLFCGQMVLAQTPVSPDTTPPTDLDNFIALHNLQTSSIKSFEESVADIILKFGEAAIANQRLSTTTSFDFTGKDIGNTHFENGILKEQRSYLRESNSESKWNYNDAGNVIKRYDTHFNNTGEKYIWTLFENDDTKAFMWRYAYAYNEDGLPSEITKFFPDGKTDVLVKFTYDDAANKITERYYNGDEFYRLEKYTYEANKLAEELFYDAKDNLTGNNKYTYDERGNLLSLSKFDADKGLVSRKKYEYDIDNNRTIEQSYNQEDELTQQINYSFDAGGNKLSEVLYDSEGNQILGQTLSYNFIGQLSKKFYYNADGTIDRGFEYSYTDSGDILETKNFIFGGAHFSTDVCEYKNLDNYGNWTERNCVLFKRVSGQFQADYGVSDSEVTLRTFEYFE